MALEQFCFCCKLRNGVFIWGSLCIIRSFVVFVTIVAGGVASSDVFIEIVNTGGYDDSNGALSYTSSPYSTYKTDRSAVFWLIVTASVIDFISSVLLVVGAVKRNHFLMLPWIILNGIALVPFGIATLFILIILLPIYLPVYIWWCICSAYQNIQENPPPPYDKFDSLLLSDSLSNTRIMSSSKS